jgi:DeoR/GlpR family transcriptional regulator of sugar metabolism
MSIRSAAERRYELVQILEARGSLSYDELAEQLQVSTMTIRRDVDLLSNEGIVFHPISGKIALKRDVLFELNLEQKKYVRLAQKRAIAAFCADLVEDNETVFIDAGTTNTEVARSLVTRLGVAIVTNSLSVASVVAMADGACLSMCPGSYRRRSADFLGVLAIDFLNRQDVDIAFIGVAGISPGFGLSVSNVPEWVFKKSLVTRAKKTICAADSSKLGMEWLCSICPLCKVDLIVTDEGISNHMAAACHAAGTDVAIVDSRRFS